ncbi:angiopoietin-related protein 7 isoform X2 [Drosophila obscura]|uniref:angiopoietin-related protein 7 isoform X2 n=1 Tax=Drosophila obscura TaxID=7282 RepID=UPI001BB0EB9B|nr:angiopoietin-related protein 7 isoform X2 [Drosophila obscura]
MSNTKLNNLSQEVSASENNSLSSDSEDIEDVLANEEVRDHQILLKLLRHSQKKILKNATTIKDFKGKLTEAEIQLAIHKEKANLFDEKCRDKDYLITSLKASIQMNNEMNTRITASHDIKIKLMQNRITELLSNSGITQHTQLQKLEDQISDYKRIIDLHESTILELNENVAKLEIKAKLDATNIENKDQELSKVTNRIGEGESTISKLNEKVAALELEAKLAESGLKQKDEEIEDTPSFRGYKLTRLVSSKLIEITGHAPFVAPVEDITSDGNEWIVIQRRFDGSVNFANGSYVNGFGSCAGEFWLGLDKLNILTHITPHELYIQLVDFDDNIWYARYDHFVVEDKDLRYLLGSLGYYEGNAGDSLRPHIHFDFEQLKCGSWWRSNLKQCNIYFQ